MKIIILLIFAAIIFIGAKETFAHWYFKYKLSRLNLDKDEDILKAFTMIYGKAEIAYRNVKVLFAKEYDPKVKGMYYDFSLWKDKGIIGVVCKTDKEELDGEIGLKLNQTIYEFEGGHFLWFPK